MTDKTGLILKNLPEISIILPIFNEVENLPILLSEIFTSVSPLNRSFEVIAVNDGSTDGSLEELRKLKLQYSSMRIISFRKNFGQSAAFDAGFRAARGEILVTLDSDRQNDPKDIPPMIALADQGFDFISGWRKNRKDPIILRKIPSLIANWIIRKVTGTKIHDLGCSLKVYRKHITNEIRLYGEMHRFLGPLAESAGANVTEYVTHHRARVAGVSKYGITRTFKVLMDLLTVWFMKSYQTKPIYIFGGAGITAFLISVLCFAWALWDRLYLEVRVHNNPVFLLAILSFLAGLQFLAMGLIAEIIIRVYYESQNKSSYVVAHEE